MSHTGRHTRLARFTLIQIVLVLLAVEHVGALSIDPPADLLPAIHALRGGTCLSHLPVLRQQADRPTPAGARASYLLGHCLDQAGEIAEAKAVFDALVRGFVPLASHARFHAARLAQQSGSFDEAASVLNEVVAESTSPSLARRAKLLQAEVLLQVGRTEAARERLRDLLRRSAEDEIVARTWWLYGMASERIGDRRQAAHAYGMAWWAVPENQVAGEALQRLRDLSQHLAPEPPAEARAERAKRLIARGEPEEAERELVSALRGSLPPAVVAEAWYRLGILRRGTPAAAFAFRQAARYPDGAARAMYWVGRTVTAAGQEENGKAIWKRVLREYPTSVWAGRALLGLARLAEASKAWREADRTYAELARRFPTSRLGDEARWRRGWIHYRWLRNYSKAEAIFMQSARAFPSSPRAAANLYWASKARQRQGRDGRSLLARVAAQYPFTYYGQRARARRRQPAPDVDPPPAFPSLPQDSFGTPYEELGTLGFDRDAADEAEARLQVAPHPDILRVAAILRARAGEVSPSVAIAEQAIAPARDAGAHADAGLWMLAYPRPYWEQVSAAAQTHGVDPYLVLAVMREESTFNPTAVSIAGAVGLMQLLPSTARGLVSGGEVTPQHLTDPGVSIRHGTAYLAGLLRRFTGDVVLAVAAYNAGPVAARRFARLRGADEDVFMESIPFAETRAYVQRVLETHGIYRWLYR